VNVLIVVATHGEAARLAGLPATVLVCGVGPVAAALATQRALHTAPRPDLVISAGIGGAFVQQGHPAPLRPGQAAVASEMLYGDLGAWEGPHFLGLNELGLSVLPGGPPNPGRFPAWVGSEALAARLGLACGPFVTVSGVTGSHEQAQQLQKRIPGALVEGMEGAGVAQAAAQLGVPCSEIRGISNLVGPRDRASWQLSPALDALHSALAGLLQMGGTRPPEIRKPGPR
jgi:futalosine hydrolase